MSTGTRESKLAELEQLKQRIAELEKELERPAPRWRPREFYTAYYATTGFMLGMLGAVTSLLFNVVGSALVGQHPLKLIQVYLTFPLGEKALTIDSGLTLVIGCCLYLGTGMLLGAPFQVLLAYFTTGKSTTYRMVVATALAISMWIGHFYIILAWLQPLLFGDNWIVRDIPWWVGMLTHVVYGLTMALVFPLGLYTPYQLQTEQA